MRRIFTCSGESADPYERMEMISLVLIESIEALGAVQSA